MNNFSYGPEEKDSPALPTDSESKDTPVQQQEPQYLPPAPQQFPPAPQQYYAPAAPQQNPYAAYPTYQQPQQFQPVQQQNPYMAYPSQQTQPMQPTGSAPMISLVISGISMLFMWIIPFIGVISSIVGVIFGHKGLKDNPPNQYGNGRGLAMAGVIVGYVSLLGSVGWTGFVLLIMSI